MSYSQVWAIVFFVLMILTLLKIITTDDNVLMIWIIFAGIFAFPIWLILTIFELGV